jgi:hypothetical protein
MVDSKGRDTAYLREMINAYNTLVKKRKKKTMKEITEETMP